MYNLPPPDAADLAAYEKLDGVPECLLQNAISATTEDQAKALARAFVGDRNGYANNRDMPPEEGDLLQLLHIAVHKETQQSIAKHSNHSYAQAIACKPQWHDPCLNISAA